MTWFKVDDGFSTHAKVDNLGPDQPLAIAAWTLCGSACARDLTDGLVTVAALRRTLCAWTPKDQTKAVEALVRVGLWHEVDGGWHFHKWAEYQPLRASVEADRDAARERMASRRKAKFGGSSPEVRANIERTSPEVRKTFERSSLTPSRPVPTRPDPSHSESNHPGFCSALYASWKAAFGRVPGTGHPDKLDASWGILGAGLTRHEATTLEKCQAVASVMTAEQVPGAIESFKADAYATKSGHPFDLFVRQAPQYLTKRPLHPSAGSDFSNAPENPEF